MEIMNKEARIDAFFKARQAVLKKDGAWCKKASVGLFARFCMGGLLFMTLLLWRLPFNLFSIVILVFAGMLLVSVVYGLVSIPKVLLYHDRMVYKRFPAKKSEMILYDEITGIHIDKKNTSSVNYGAWVFNLKDGHKITIDKSIVTDEDFALFFRSNFLPLVWDDGEMEGFPNALSTNIMRLAAMVIKVDGDLSEKAEDRVVDYIWENYYHADPASRLRVVDRWAAIMKARQHDYKIYCNRIIASRKLDYWARYDIVDLLFECAYVSQGINKIELEFLREIAGSLKLRTWHIVSLENDYECRVKSEGMDTGNYLFCTAERRVQAYEALGLSDGASLEDVKRCYRQLVMSCHPDKMPANLSAERKEDSLVRFRAITEAYDYLCDALN